MSGAESLVGTRLGAYRITGVVGRGGMGVVYRAVRDDDQYQKQVAIKLVHRGLDARLVSRFRNERQILARLENPRIARLLDGGATEDGQPYFVMEYIEGRPITEYCEVCGLAARERLKLFRFVCMAVQHAHQNLIVHRDLKPSNILVTEDAVPKLLDFGIAKLLEGGDPGNTTETWNTLRMLTPDYASPEQVRGEPVTTATDVYSLGVILFELLTGRRPHKFASQTPTEIERVICEIETPKPSSMATRPRDLEGDLDNIVLMAMKKEPQRRYGSVEQFSEDVRRYLEGLPIQAREDTLFYRTGKFIQRNRLYLGAGALVTASLVASIVATTYQARRAERRFQQVRQLANTFLFDFHDKIRSLPGSTAAQETVVRTALEYLSSLAPQSGSDPTLRMELARAYLRVGDVQGNPLESNLGDTAGAMASYRKAAEILDKLAAPVDAAAARSRLAEVHARLGALLRVSGDVEGGLKSFRSAQSLLEGLLEKDPRNRQLEGRLAGLYDTLARHLTAVNDLKGAVEITTKALALYEDLAAADSGNAALQSDLASAYSTAGILMSRTEQVSEALAQQQKALAIRERLVAKDPANVQHRRNLMILSSHLGDVLGSPTRPNLGRVEEAVEHYRRMLRIAEELAASDASDRKARLDLANSLLRIGHVLGAGAETEESLRHLRRSLGIVDELQTGDPANTGLRMTAAFLHTRIAEVLEQRGAAGEAFGHFEQAWSHARALLAKDPKNTEVQNQFLHVARGYGPALARRGKREQAIEAVGMMLPVADRIAQPDSEWRLAAQRSNADRVAGEVYLDLAKHVGTAEERKQDQAKARSYLERSMKGWAELQRDKRLSRLYSGEPARTAALLAGIQ